MSNESSKHEQVLATFNKVTPDYDKLNRAMTLGQHAKWCEEVARLAEVPDGGRLLDIATGTGPIAFAARAQHPSAEITACDFSESMLEEASSRPGAGSITWGHADANELRFEDGSFDAVTHGYLLRNVDDVERVLREQYRVLKPGGRVVILETCPPRGLLKFPVSIGVRIVVPLLGQLLAGNRDSYEYLARSTLDFMAPDQVAEIMARIGFTGIRWRRRFLTTHMILRAEKPA